MSLPANVKTVRVANLEAHHKTAYNILTSVGKTLATIATALGITQDLAEKQMSILIDEGLAVRTVGSRTSATYKLA